MTGFLQIFKEVRTDVPEEVLQTEARAFVAKYPGKDPVRDKPLAITWAKRIDYKNQKDAFTKDFERIAQENARKYGAA